MHTMQTFITSLMAALLLFQAMTGVCCYHSATCSCQVDAAAVSEADTLSCCDRCQSKLPTNQLPKAPCPHHDCMGFCTFVASDPVQIDFSELVVPFDLLLSESVFRNSSVSRELVRYLATHPPACKSTVRLHLLNQIMLI
jgi:hypothetical protein